MTDQSRQPYRAYLGSFTSAGGRGITTATVDPDDGALEPVHHTGTAVPDPSYLAVGDRRLYAVCEREAGAAVALSLADPGRPEPVAEPVPVRGAGPAHLALADGRLFTVNYVSGSVTGLPLRADGTLGGRPEVHPHHGSGPVTARQEGPHAHEVVPDPSGRWLHAANERSGDVTWFALDEATGVPHRAGAVETPAVSCVVFG